MCNVLRAASLVALTVFATVACGARSGLLVDDPTVDATPEDTSTLEDVGRDAIDATLDSTPETSADSGDDGADSVADADVAEDIGPPPPTGAVEVSIGLEDTCARTGEGRVRCWGFNEWSIVGDGTTTKRLSPAPAIAGFTDVAQLSIGASNTACALRTDGTVACWGRIDTGILGDGVSPRPPGYISTPQIVPGVHGAIEVAVGVQACALMPDGTMTCWGGCASGTTSPCTTITPSTFPGVDHVAHMIFGWIFQCVLRTTGDVWCWGQNRDGELGDGTSSERETPAPVPGLTDVKMLAGGGMTSRGACAVKGDGSVWCWGLRLKDGYFQGISTPERVVGLTGPVDAIATYSSNSCAIVAGSLECWGDNQHGALGIAGAPPSEKPMLVPGLSGVRAVAIGGNSFPSMPGQLRVCALLGDGVPRCWGAPLVGDDSELERDTPVSVGW
jgi:alpha-tubulin suppressor-like RCC1 family protein